MYIRLFYNKKIEAVVAREWNKKKHEHSIARAKYKKLAHGVDMTPESSNNHLWLAHLNKTARRMYETETNAVKDIVRKEIDAVMAQKRAMEDALAGTGTGTSSDRLQHLQK